MKRKEKLITLFILIMILTITLIYKVSRPQKVMKTLETDNKLVSMFYEQENGKYVTAEASKWPIRSYVFNSGKSYCENKSELEWNDNSKRIKVKVYGTDKCYVYFDLEELGTKESPYRIRVIEDLVDLAIEVNDGETYEGSVFVLGNDLDFQNPNDYENAYREDYGNLNGVNDTEPLIEELTNTEGSGFTPIGAALGSGSIGEAFSGIFNGHNHTISNIYINNKTETASVGLFGVINNATISNLKIDGEIKTEVNGNMGAISGRTYGNTVIDNIENHVNVTGFSNSGSNGGILGSTNTTDGIVANVTLKNCKNYGNISYGNQSAGLIAWIQGIVTIENCHNFGNITLSNGLRAGGLVGAGEGSQVDKYLDTLVIKESSNSGTVYGANLANSSNQNSGGLIGLTSSISNAANHNIKYVVLNSYNAGEVTGGTAGGIIGKDNTVAGGNVYIYNCANRGNITGSTYGSGIIGYTNNGYVTIKNVYNLGKISGSQAYGIIYSNLTNETIIEDAYFAKDYIQSGSNKSTNGLIAISSDEIKNQNFVNTLNNNLTTINFEIKMKDINISGLLEWKLDSDNIPNFNEEIIYYPYTGNYQIFEVHRDGIYNFELWGAQGGNASTTYLGGKGAYTFGKINLKQGEKLYVYVGQQGASDFTLYANSITDPYSHYTWSVPYYRSSITYNNGTYSHQMIATSFSGNGMAGGGATDIRLEPGDWDSFDSLKTRIMVAAGGGGTHSINGIALGAAGGALTGFNGVIYGADGTAATGGTQDSGGIKGGGVHSTLATNGSFGKGGQSMYMGGGGGSGYYGGGSGPHGSGTAGSGAGGSSFISGHPDCNAISEDSTETEIKHTNQPEHYSGKVFTETKMIAGDTEMPNPNGNNETGHSGNGYAKITFDE